MAAKNLTPQKHATIFGIFVQPSESSGLHPRIVAVRESNGQKLALQPGRPFGGKYDHQTAAFVKVNSPGPLTVRVAGTGRTTGSYNLDVTLAGDINGDGVVNLADLDLFAPTYYFEAG